MHRRTLALGLLVQKVALSSCLELWVLKALARHTLLHNWPSEGYGSTQQRAEY